MDRPSGAGEVDIWVASPVGPARRSVDWQPQDGDWTAVIMQADGTAGLAVQARAGATVPGLPWLAGGLFTMGAILALVGVLLVVLAVHGRRSARPRVRHPAGAPPTPRGPVGSDAANWLRVWQPGSQG